MSQKTILIVEDVPEINQALCDLLALSGYRVRSAANGEEAWRDVRQGFPDLILLDMSMPVMNGWEFARRLRDAYGRRVPIVVLSGLHDAARRAKEIDAEGYVGKPTNIDELLSVIQRILSPVRHPPGSQENP